MDKLTDLGKGLAGLAGTEITDIVLQAPANANANLLELVMQLLITAATLFSLLRKKKKGIHPE